MGMRPLPPRNANLAFGRNSRCLAQLLGAPRAILCGLSSVAFLENGGGREGCEGPSDGLRVPRPGSEGRLSGNIAGGLYPFLASAGSCPGRLLEVGEMEPGHHKSPSAS